MLKKRIALAASLCALVLAGPTGGAPGWLSAEDLSAPGQHASSTEVALDAAGNALAAWVRAGVVQSSWRPAGGAWQPTQNVSVPSQPADFLQLAMNARGDAIAIWKRENGANDVIQAAVRPVGASWQAVQDVSAAGMVSAPDVALDAAGNAVAVWTGHNGSHFEIVAAIRPAGGAWQPPTDLSAPGQHNDSPEVAIDPAGNTVVVWRGQAASHVARAAVRPVSDGIWQGPQDISAADDYAVGPQVSVDAAGNAVAVWQGFKLGEGGYKVRTAFRPAGGPWGAPQDISGVSVESMGADVDMASGGTAVAIWTRAAGSDQRVEAAVRPTGGGWEAPVPLSAPGTFAYSPRAAFDAAPNAVAAWQGLVGADSIVQGTSRFGGTWLPAIDLSEAGQAAVSPQVASDPAGNAFAVWERSNGTHYIAQAALYDGAGPLLRSVRAPARGFARQRLTFSVDAFDVGSPLGPPVWTFGDGKSATGQTVTHTYARGGKYVVTVTQHDAVGNASSAQRLLTLRVARCFGRAATRVGTAGADRIVGTRRADVIVTLAGADRVRGRGGPDRICGGKGRDRLAGGAGNDLLNGGPGRDVCSQGRGRGRLVAC